MAKFTLSYVYKVVDQYSRPLQKIKKNTEKYRAALKRATAQAKKFALALSRVMRKALKSSLLSIGRFISKIGLVSGALGALASVASVFSLGALVNSFVSATDELAKFSRQIGLSGQDLRKLQFIAARQGVSAEALTTSMRALNRISGELKAGRGTLYTYLKESNPELLKQVKNADSLKETFNLIMTAMSKMKSPSERAVLAQAAFSEAGLSMTRIAEAGAPAIEALGKEFERLRGFLTEEDLSNAEAFADSLENLSTAMGGIKDVIAKQLVPALKPFIDRMTEFIAANRELIGLKAGEVIEKIGNALEGIDTKILNSFMDAVKEFDVTSFIETATEFVDKIKDVSSNVKFLLEDYWKPMVATIIAVSFAPAIAALATLAVALGPAGAVAIAIGAGIMLMWPKIKESWAGFEEFWDGIVNDFHEWKDEMLAAADEFMKGIISKFQAAGDAIKSFLGLQTRAQIQPRTPTGMLVADQQMLQHLGRTLTNDNVSQSAQPGMPSAFTPGFWGQNPEVRVDNKLTGTIRVEVPTNANATANFVTEEGMPVGSNIVAAP